MMPHDDIPIKYIDTGDKLISLVNILETKNEFAFDTEFDRFYREYGFKLSLLQIFDGENVYLVDPIAIKDLKVLWPVFENRDICKVVYSCSEDIQLLKVNGCNPRNIYDLQIAAKLCNYSATSLAGMMMIAFGIEADKSLQRSNWRRRPLSKEQIIYAGNDVSRLLKLKRILEEISTKRGVGKMIDEDNRACEKIPVTEFAVKLSVTQKRKYDHGHQKYLLDLMYLRNEIAIEYNVPPANIVSDVILEIVIEKPSSFLATPFLKGFCKRLSEDDRNKNRFLSLIKGFDNSFKPTLFSLHKPVQTENTFREARPETEFDRKYLQLYDAVVKEFGKESGEHILRGYKKSLSSDYPRANKLKDYQLKIIDEIKLKLGLDFGKA